jgi:hypothetical protein
MQHHALLTDLTFKQSAQKTAKSERFSGENLEAGCIIIPACHAAP